MIKLDLRCCFTLVDRYISILSFWASGVIGLVFFASKHCYSIVVEYILFCPANARGGNGCRKVAREG